MLASCTKSNSDKSEDSSTRNSTNQYNSTSGYGSYNSLLTDAYVYDDEDTDDEEYDDEEYSDDEDSEYWEDDDLLHMRMTWICLTMRMRSPTCRTAVWVIASGIPLPAPPQS